MTPTPASGRQVVLGAGDLTATVAEVGAALRGFTADGMPLIHTHADEDYARFAEGQVLVPWPNRIAGGTYVHAGRREQLPVTEPETGHAVHGLARWAAWQIRAAGVDRAMLALELHPQAGYPFRLSLEVEYALAPDGLLVTTTAQNTGSRALPYGCGFHPYLTVGTPRIDEARLSIPAATRVAVDDGGIPTGTRLAVAGSRWDLRGSEPIGSLELDTVFTDLERDGAGRAEVRLEAPDGRGVTLWMDAAHPYVMAFTGDPLPEADRRRSIAIEPMTCAPDAFNSGDGLQILEPGESLVTRWGLAPLTVSG
ncbi:MAG: hypothetical protein AVDCRST_MAG69-929 [uncultured Solirubrobacteraceae bacterium]|uniref:Aldose 1-epimerase n=1 Tax=uncultured Solirubrobacteraceae bacterium TaxID=1162706 RepID=A0A6J4S5X9_9ACTN|nr:MAG: hypothetical protein AVDCRST_MAG69-929 [uncultured Solirubrobacteraceae bacterium]